MDRRTFLTAVLATQFLSPFLLTRAHAQQVPNLSPVLSGDFAQDPALFARLRRLSASFIELRGLYQGPFGYEQDDWLAQAFDTWRLAYGANFDEGFGVAARDVPDFLSRGLAQNVLADLEARLAANYGTFATWMSDLGIAPDGPLAQDFLLAQSAMAVLLAAKTPEIQADESFASLDAFTWIFPICSG